MYDFFPYTVTGQLPLKGGYRHLTHLKNKNKKKHEICTSNGHNIPKCTC